MTALTTINGTQAVSITIVGREVVNYVKLTEAPKTNNMACKSDGFFWEWLDNGKALHYVIIIAEANFFDVVGVLECKLN